MIHKIERSLSGALRPPGNELETSARKSAVRVPNATMHPLAISLNMSMTLSSLNLGVCLTVQWQHMQVASGGQSSHSSV